MILWGIGYWPLSQLAAHNLVRNRVITFEPAGSTWSWGEKATNLWASWQHMILWPFLQSFIWQSLPQYATLRQLLQRLAFLAPQTLHRSVLAPWKSMSVADIMPNSVSLSETSQRRTDDMVCAQMAKTTYILVECRRGIKSSIYLK
jgi:hypothetical protein